MIKNKLIVIVSFILGLISILLIVGGILLTDKEAGTIDNSNTDADKNIMVKHKMYICTKNNECSDKTCTSSINVQILYDNDNATNLNTIVEYKYSDELSYNGMVKFFKNVDDSSKYEYNNKTKIITMTSKEDIKDTLINDLIISYKDNGYKCNIEEY